MSPFEILMLLVAGLMLMSIWGISSQLDKVVRAIAVVGQQLDDRLGDIEENVRSIDREVSSIK